MQCVGVATLKLMITFWYHVVWCQLDNPTSDIKKLGNPNPDIKKLDNPTSDIKKLDNPTSDIKKLDNPTSDIKKLDNPTSDIKKLDNPTSDIKKLDNPTSDIKKLGNPTSDFIVIWLSLGGWMDGWCLALHPLLAKRMATWDFVFTSGNQIKLQRKLHIFYLCFGKSKFF